MRLSWQDWRLYCFILLSPLLHGFCCLLVSSTACVQELLDKCFELNCHYLIVIIEELSLQKKVGSPSRLTHRKFFFHLCQDEASCSNYQLPPSSKHWNLQHGRKGGQERRGEVGGKLRHARELQESSLNLNENMFRSSQLWPRPGVFRVTLGVRHGRKQFDSFLLFAGRHPCLCFLGTSVGQCHLFASLTDVQTTVLFYYSRGPRPPCIRVAWQLNT